MLTAERPAIGALQQFAYDLDGRIRESAVLRQSGTFESTAYGYDDAGRLTSLNRPGAAGEIYTYNSDDTVDLWTTRQTNSTGVQLNLRHRYDAANRFLPIDIGNRSSFQGEGLPDGLESLDFGDLYSWDRLSRPKQIAKRIGENDDNIDLLSRVTYAYGEADPRALPEEEIVGAWRDLWTDVPEVHRAYDLFDNAQLMQPPPAAGLLAITSVFDDLDRPEHVSSAFGHSTSGTTGVARGGSMDPGLGDSCRRIIGLSFSKRVRAFRVLT